ncbi:efflux transporter outer membrane subunit [Gluconacetobacter azotocaptans]|uniref:Efflux transporter outer membrane subunit n=1 Tax=Gluconacetobacter azotocaptans TaxID=142834 RepID=A0A7W4JVK5_9PROT|nr:efflux transporter outer membrane subunit [Gluconacetobacter azotocaptans]MBB2191703.1 efflux transporter outer membrane subunit [Gluconacetobacter azotocaptans]MBM9403183.1 efflux transporter outer membrane subunit [Gluconacetobacter azotocaptans]GBQ33470.1 secretion system type I outer membrane efflux pump lipoprotein NodT [Gluconacetobacter azotocaptans DSM 13594]
MTMKTMTRRASLFLTSALFLAGCTVGPRYQPDRMKLPAAFTEDEHPATPDEIARTNAELKEWWHRFNDPELDKLVDRAIAGNYDLQIAGQRILAERALRDVQASAWYPQVDANTTNGDSRYSLNIDNWPLRPGNPANRPGASYLSYGVSASWQVDVFGRIRRSVEAQEHAVEQTIEERRAVLMTMLSSLVSDYMVLRDTQLRLDISNRNIRVAQDAYDLTQRLYLEGVGNTLQIAQAKAELDAQLAAREPLRTHIAQITHALDVLMGQVPGTTEAELKIARPLPKVPDFPATLPSIVLANRPDIRRAERAYAEATARIGVAVAQMYPNFSIPLNFNPNASAMYQLFEAGALSWQFFMLASVPLMHGGKLTGQIRAAQAAAEASRLGYRQTVLQAFREVEDAMAAWHDDVEHTELLHRAAEDSTLASERARKLYGAGLVGFLEVLTTERTALAAENAEAVAQLERLQDAIDLYTAMGAGWQGVGVTAASLPVSLETQNVLARALKQ